MADEKVVRQLDAAALRRIFDNILSNAVKYSDGDLAVSLLPDGSVTFSNSAQTLSRVQAERLFDRFYTVEAARNSTGLGLSIARLLVEKMNGTITADYKDGKLHICVCFPQQNEENTEEQSSGAGDTENQRKNMDDVLFKYEAGKEKEEQELRYGPLLLEKKHPLLAGYLDREETLYRNVLTSLEGKDTEGAVARRTEIAYELRLIAGVRERLREVK